MPSTMANMFVPAATGRASTPLSRARPIIGFTDIFSRYRYRYQYIGSDITNIGIGIIGIGIC